MKLDAAQEQTIIDFVTKQKLTIATLEEDLIDHVCCETEARMNDGLSFETALNSALADVAPNGLQKIESETIALINPNKLIFMKKFIYLIGLICAMTASVGYFAGMLRFPVGVVLGIAGVCGFAFLFLPMLFVSQYRSMLAKSGTEKAKYYLGFLSAELLGLAFGMKMLHLAGADMMLILGGALFTLAFLPLLFFSLYQKSSQGA